MGAAVVYRGGWAVIDLETRRPVAFAPGNGKALERAKRWARDEEGKGRLARYTIAELASLVLPKGDEME